MDSLYQTGFKEFTRLESTITCRKLGDSLNGCKALLFLAKAPILAAIYPIDRVQLHYLDDASVIIIDDRTKERFQIPTVVPRIGQA